MMETKDINPNLSKEEVIEFLVSHVNLLENQLTRKRELYQSELTAIKSKWWYKLFGG